MIGWIYKDANHKTSYLIIMPYHKLIIMLDYLAILLKYSFKCLEKTQFELFKNVIWKYQHKNS